MMMKILLLILIISANCVKMNCDEEPSTTENFNEESEKTELVTAEQELQSKTENIQNKNNASKIIEDSDESRVSRSSPELSANSETQSNDSLKSLSTEASMTEKSASEEIITEIQDGQDDKELNQPTRRENSESPVEEDKKSLEVIEEQLKESHDTSGSSKTEDRKAEDIPEASAESKLSDNEKASSVLNVTDRNSETKEELLDDLRFNESLQTRRMFSGPDDKIVDKMRADTTPTAVKPEVKTALNQNINTYNNLNEFGSSSNNKIIDLPRSTASPEKTNTPIDTKLAAHEITNQRYLPKFYPHPELNINFPNINSDFQGPRDLPIYLKMKQDELQSQNHFTGAQVLQSRLAQESNFANPSNQQQFHQPQNTQQTQERFPNKRFDNLRVESRIEKPKQYQNPVPRYFEDVRNQNHQIWTNPNQDNINQDHKFLNREARNEEIKDKAKIAFKKNDEPGNQYPLLQQPEGILHTKFIDQRFGAVPFKNPHSATRPFLLYRNPQQDIVLYARRNNVFTIRPNIQMLFQRLASASLFPWNLSANLYLQ